MRKTSLDETDLTGAELTDADLTHASLTAANWKGATLQRALFHRAALLHTRMGGADLRGARGIETARVEDLEVGAQGESQTLAEPIARVRLLYMSGGRYPLEEWKRGPWHELEPWYRKLWNFVRDPAQLSRSWGDVEFDGRRMWQESEAPTPWYLARDAAL